MFKNEGIYNITIVNEGEKKIKQPLGIVYKDHRSDL